VPSGRTALVTGGSRGIGRAIVERFARDGAQVVFTYLRNKAAADEVVEATASLEGSIGHVQADLANVEDVRRVFAEAEDRLGGLDIVVNNAAVVVSRIPFAEMSEETYDHVMGSNAKGTFFAVREAARRLRDGGRLVNISSLNTALPMPGLALYCASKAAVEQFTAVAAKELGPRGITVNTVSPGATDTDMLRGENPPEVLDMLAGMSPLGRIGQPADVADVVAFLAGPDGRWITGQNLRATGGIT